MTFKTKIALRGLALTAAIFTPSAAIADRILLADGRVLEGTIEKSTTQSQESASPDRVVTIAVAGSRISLPMSQIRSITASTPQEKALMDARDAWRAGRLDEAAALLDAMLTNKVSSDAIAAMLFAESEPSPNQLGELSPNSRAAMSRVLAALHSAPMQQPESKLRLARLHFGLGEVANGGAVLDELGPDFFATHPDEQKKLAAWLNGQLDAGIEHNRYEEGLKLLDQLKRVDASQAEGRRVQFYLQSARRLRDAGKFEDALKIYAEHLMTTSPQIAQEYIRRALGEAERTLEPRGEHEQIVRLYEVYGIPVIPVESRERIATIWHNVGWRALRREEFIEAQVAFEKEEKAKTGSAAIDLLQLEFRRRAKDVAAKDLLGQYELGVWANDHALWDEAIQQFRKALPSPIVKENAQAYIDKIMNQEAERELKRLMGLHEKGEYRDTLNGVYAFQKAGYGQGYQEQAKRISEITLEAMTMQVAERPQQAETLLQQAERAFYQERYDEAADRLKTLVERFKDTVVYPKALSLLARVREQQSLSELEQRSKPQPVKIDVGATSITNPVAIETPVPTPQPPPSAMGDEIEELYRSLGRNQQP